MVIDFKPLKTDSCQLVSVIEFWIELWYSSVRWRWRLLLTLMFGDSACLHSIYFYY